MAYLPKSVARPVTENDLPALMDLARQAGPGMTNLPKDEKALQEKIVTSLHSFANGKRDHDLLGYFFVLEDLTSKKIVGCSGICAAGSEMLPFYHFKMSTVNYVNQELNLNKSHRILTMVNDYHGCSEVCSLFLRPDYREFSNGSLISRTRFLFMAEFSDRFSETVIAEMRGVMGENGAQPFWDDVISKFIDLPFLEADRLTGIGVKQFIPDLMPRYPLYVELLPKRAQDVIDKVHIDTEPALALLKKEGFMSQGYIDIFEAGSMVESKLNRIYSVRKSKKVKVSELRSTIPHNPENLYLISNASIDLRVCLGDILLGENSDNVVITEEVANVLNITLGQEIRYVPLKIDVPTENGSNNK